MNARPDFPDPAICAPAALPVPARFHPPRCHTRRRGLEYALAALCLAWAVAWLAVLPLTGAAWWLGLLP